MQHPSTVRRVAAEASEDARALITSMRHADIRMRSAGLDRRALPDDVRKLIRDML